MQEFQSLTKYISLISKDDIGTWVIDRENDGSMEHPIHFPFFSNISPYRLSPNSGCSSLKE